MNLQIKTKLLTANAIIPKRANPEGDAGYDLFSTEYLEIAPFERKLISTGVALEIPEGYYGRIAPRSGLALKNGIDVMAGVIDSSYRNEIKVLLINLNCITALSSNENIIEAFSKKQNSIIIKPGDRIAQIIFERCYTADLLKVDNLSDSVRGLGGFGSTGT